MRGRQLAATAGPLERRFSLVTAVVDPAAMGVCAVQCSRPSAFLLFPFLHLKNLVASSSFLFNSPGNPNKLQPLPRSSTDRSPDISNLRFFLAPDGDMICVGTSIERAVVSHDRFSCARSSRLWQIPDAGERRDEGRQER